jgi:hypothetical protein
MIKNKLKYLILFLLCICGLVFVNLMKHNIIATPKLFHGPFSFVFILLMAVIMLWWGFYDLNKLKLENRHKNKREKKLFGIFSKTPSDPIATLSYGQIIGGIMMIGFIIFWIIKYGFNFN